MPTTRVPTPVIENAVHLAGRAPSYHNSQPWRWVADDQGLHLHLDTTRILATDAGGRQALLSCGAALDHLRVAMAAAGHHAHIDYYPNPNDLFYLAGLRFSPMTYVTQAHRHRAEAILRRRSDRLPFAAPTNWADVEPLLRQALPGSTAWVDIIGDGDRHVLADTSRLAEVLRRYDAGYHAEMQTWTQPHMANAGIPRDALVSSAENSRVDIGRTFPVTGHQTRRPELTDDKSKVVVVSACDNLRRDILSCGETLSAILLEATLSGLATCTLTHLTEAPVTRDLVAALTGRPLPQVLIRIGSATPLDDEPARTPRRPLSEVLHWRADTRATGRTSRQAQSSTETT